MNNEQKRRRKRGDVNARFEVMNYSCYGPTWGLPDDFFFGFS
jgi:hypothetical protein